jgi:ATP-dependent DNA helicase Rep
LTKLNPQQMAAVRYLDGPLLVLAGAGSGKTRVITEKMAYLIEHCGYAPHSVYAVTFTNKAANEMKHRVRMVLPAQARRGLKVATFHTLGLSMIKRDLARCGLKPGFSIFDAEDSAQIIRGLLPVARVNDREEVKRVQAYVSTWKNDRMDQIQIEQLTPTNAVFEEAIRLYPRYQQTLRAYNAVDFDDLICLPVQLLSAHEDSLLHWQHKIKYLLIDEYQDSNACQYALVQRLVAFRQSFTVVGDDDQSIYAWRGAKPENLTQLKSDYPQLKLIKLEQNYRSTGRILQAANQLISHNPHVFTKKLWSELGPGDLLRVLCCKDEQDEADQVIADLISHKIRFQTKHSDYAILYRGNHQSRAFEAALRQHGIPYRVSGGQSWFARTEVRDIFAYLRLLSNDSDDAAFLRVINTPKRGIGDTTLEALGHYAQQRGQSLYACCDHLALSACLSETPRAALQAFKAWLEGVKKRCSEGLVVGLSELVDAIGYEGYLYEQCDTPVQAQKRMEHVWELIAWVERLWLKADGGDLRDVIHRLMLIDRLEQAEDPSLEAVQLMTLHASKGLEFPYVYLVGLEEGLLPHRVSIEDEAIEEERRLAYVGITRAQKALCLSLSKQRRRAGELHDCMPSRFLDELPEGSLEWYGKSGVRNEEQSKALAQNHLAGLKQMLV